eukprot:scaffold421270_cov64-Attheya_sp.AAC.1
MLIRNAFYRLCDYDDYDEGGLRPIKLNHQESTEERETESSPMDLCDIVTGSSRDIGDTVH